MKASRSDGELRWLHKVRLYPTCAQDRALVEVLRTTRELYNALLQQRRDARTTRRRSFGSKQQCGEITELPTVEPRFAAVYRECEEATVRRLDLAMAAFFRRLKRVRRRVTHDSKRHHVGNRSSSRTATGVALR